MVGIPSENVKCATVDSYGPLRLACPLSEIRLVSALLNKTHPAQLVHIFQNNIQNMICFLLRKEGIFL